MLSVTFYGPKIGSILSMILNYVWDFYQQELKLPEDTVLETLSKLCSLAVLIFLLKYHEMNYTFYVMILKICTAANN